MARVPDEEIERLKKEVDLAELVIRSGVALKKAGGDLVGCCPFHDDGTPSLGDHAAKNLWHCMGACQVGGSAIDWVMRTQGVSFRHAVEVLRAGMAPVITPGRRGRSPSARWRDRLPSPLDVSAEDQAVLSSVLDYYHATLLESPEALRYLARRKIDDPEVITRFRLGYANRTLGYRLPSKQTKEGDAVRTRLIALGVLRASGHEHLSGSIVVPVITPQGAVTELYGRKLRAPARRHAGAPLPARSAPRGLERRGARRWRGDPLRVPPRRAHVLSAPVSLTSPPPMAPPGSAADHAEAFARQRVTRVLIAYDHDAAGDEAATKLATELMASGIECWRILFPYGSDANDVAARAATPADALGEAVRAAEWMGTGTLRRPATVRMPTSRPGHGDVAARATATVRWTRVNRLTAPARSDGPRPGTRDGPVTPSPFSSAAVFSAASCARGRGRPRRAGPRDGTATLAGAPHREEPLSGQPAGQRHGVVG